MISTRDNARRVGRMSVLLSCGHGCNPVAARG